MIPSSRRVFYSFHYKPDNWRAAQVRNIGALSGNRPATDNDWEAVKRGGTQAVRAWIDEQLKGRSCTVVLIGEHTAGRKWIEYEITQSWNEGKGLLGIYIHNLADATGGQSRKGTNPFVDFKVNGKSLSKLVKTYDPPFTSSLRVYDYIARNIEDWVEEAIEIRREW